MKKVLAGGRFNTIHPGHVFFLKKAKSLGDFLTVVVANDRRNRGGIPAEERKALIESLDFVDKVRIGYSDDPLKTVLEEKPDIIALGYDQNIDENKLRKLGLNIKVVRIPKLKNYSTTRILRASGKI